LVMEVTETRKYIIPLATVDRLLFTNTFHF